MILDVHCPDCPVLCIAPFRRSYAEFGCGQCIPCRVNRRRLWTGRIGLEAAAHRLPTWFVTLTYADESLPASGALSPGHWRAFSKGIGCRYFGVGEYGGMSGRPHYHALLFGISAGEASDLVAQRWRHGFASLSPYTPERGAYIAGYVVKKWTRPDHVGLEGRPPEFARMSRRPGIGIPGLVWLARWLVTEQGALFIARTKDVPKQVRVDGKLFPLGAHCVSWLRAEAGMPEKDPNRLANFETLNRIREEEFPDLDALRSRRRVERYDEIKHRARARSSGSVL